MLLGHRLKSWERHHFWRKTILSDAARGGDHLPRCECVGRREIMEREMKSPRFLREGWFHTRLLEKILRAVEISPVTVF